MKQALMIFGEALLDARFHIAERIHEARVAGGQTDIQMDSRELLEVRAGFIELIGNAFANSLDHEELYRSVEKWGQETGKHVYHLGVPLEEALKDVTFYRAFIYDVIEEATFARQVPLRSVFASVKVIDPLLDHAVYCFSLTYIHFYKKTLKHAKTALLELSVPVVPLSKGIAVLPLIGSIDTERAGLLMEETLKAASKLKLTTLLMDLSGVLVVDTMVADRIFKVIEALKLIGVQTVLTGIRPEIAQTVVNLGLDFSKQQTRATLQQALGDLHLFPS